MPLDMRPDCERCGTNLPAEAPGAFICSMECTFCADCVETHLSNVCPNCGGGFVPRPIRPATERRKGVHDSCCDCSCAKKTDFHVAAPCEDVFRMKKARAG